GPPMKWSWISLCTLALFAPAALGQDEPKPDQPAADQPAADAAGKMPKELKEKVSYIWGFNQARRLTAGGIEFDPQAVSKGFQEAMADPDAEPKYTQEEMEQAFAEFERFLNVQREAEMKHQAEERAKLAPIKKKEAETFLAKNKQKEGVKTTESGLQYRLIEPGEGPSPKLTDVVQVHYHGTLPDGSVFDSSRQRNQPAQFPVRGVIDGWQEALQMMKVGGKWELVIPPELAYGETGSQGAIGPNQVLIFEVELLDILDQAQQPPPE
ncbi:MAG: FKBP-type peptidyl-prolyl cis-trans isomerase, partial [Planctomycetaceae bacterium]